MKPIKPAFLAITALISLLSLFPKTSNAADAARVAGNLKVDGLLFSGDTNNTLITKPSDLAFPWTILGQDIYYLSGKVGIGTMAPDSALTIKSAASSPVNIGDTGCGPAFAGIGLFGPMTKCSNYTILGENGAQKHLFINRPAGGNLSFRMDNGNQMILEQYGGLMFNANDTNNGVLNHTATTGAGLTFGFNSGEGIASKRTAGGNVWGLDFYTFSQPRLSITNSGNVGIGTTTPGSLLDINTGSGNFQVRNDNEFTPGINLSGGVNPGILRLRNSLEVWPSDDASRSGRVDVRSTTGASTIALDGQTGDISANKISAANMPAIKSTQFFGDSRSGLGFTSLNIPNDRAVDTLSVNVPSDGYLHITATLDGYFTVSANSTSKYLSNPVYFKLNETTNPQVSVQFIEQSLQADLKFTSFDGEEIASSGTITLHWTIPTGPGVRKFTTYAYAPNGSNAYSVGYYSHTLTVMYFPNSL